MEDNFSFGPDATRGCIVVHNIPPKGFDIDVKLVGFCISCCISLFLGESGVV